MLGFLGPNGAGKTTAMRTIFRLVRADAGTVTWDGSPIEADDLLRFGYMPEQSHGNQQRVQLIAALVHDPELLVLDEPFSGLDPIAVETMSDVLREQAEAGKAVVFSSHQLDLVEDLCEQVAIVNSGSVVVNGRVETLKDQAPIRHLELEVEGDPAELLGFLDGVQSTEMEGNRLVAIIGADTDVRGFIAHAQNAGRLRHFAYTTPSLSDLFREAVR